MKEQANKRTSEQANNALVYAFHRVLVRMVIGFLALLPVLAAAAAPHTLTVTLRDVRGDGIVGATITVRDEVGTTDLASATTDTHGVATFPDLTADVVRVAVSGTLADGRPLNQRGQDARGIWLLLDAPLVQLDLRSELNGVILPNPMTMISGDAPIPATPEGATLVPTTVAAMIIPTRAAIVPTDSVRGGVPTAIPFAALPAAVPPVTPPVRPAQIGRALVIVSVVIGMFLFALWLVWRRRASQ